jgi:uridine kinase
MESESHARANLLSAVAKEILHNYSRGRVIIAVDGVDGAGKTQFADGLAQALALEGHSVFRASIDDFHRPRAERYRLGKDSPEGFYRESFDYSVFTRVLINPFRMGGSTGFVLRAFDLARDAPIEPKWTTAPADAILVVDGIFLNRPELRGLWNYSVWLEASVETTASRLSERDGVSSNAERYARGQAMYLAEADPRAAATAVIDNDDFTAPKRVFADHC